MMRQAKVLTQGYEPKIKGENKMSNIWDEFEKSSTGAANGSQGSASVKDKRIEFNKPSTQVRLLSNKEGLKRMFHFIRAAGTKGRSVVCCGEGCPVCAVGDIPQPKWLMVALVRETLRVGVVQLTRGMMKGISALRKLQPFGPDMTSYDLLVIKSTERNKDGKDQTSYMVHGLPQGTVPQVDEATRNRVIAEAKELMDHLDDFAKIYSPDQTLRYLGWATPGQTGPSTSVPQPSKVTVATSTSAQVTPPTFTPATSEAFSVSSFLSKPEPEADNTFKVDPKIAEAAPSVEPEDEDTPQFKL